MLYKEDGFWDKERNSPFFNRSGFTKDSDMKMLLLKFRNVYRLTKLELDTKRGLNKVNLDLVDDMNKLKLTPNDEPKTLNCDKTESNHFNQDKKLIQNLHYDDEPISEDVLRIFKMDCERTFLDENNRKKLFNNLCSVYKKIREYHQGEGFIIALLSIYLNPEEVVKVMLNLNDNLLNGYFSSKPRNYVRDSKVLFLLLKKGNYDLWKNLESLIVPEAFVSKWFIGLTIHVFDFETIANFLNNLLKYGQVFLFQLGLSFFDYYKEKLSTTNDVSLALKLLRLDDSVLPKEDVEKNLLYYDILANSFNQEVTQEEVDELRKEVEIEMDREDLEKKKRMEQLLNEDDDDEIVFSDEE